MNFLDILSQKYNIKLNDQQMQAALHLNGPALVLSGPGSGKTTVITARTAYLVMEAGVNPQSILTLTFNRAAKIEMEQRFSTTFGSDIGQKVHFSTLHSFCNMVVRDYEKRQGKTLKRIEGEEETQGNKRRIIKDICFQVNGSNINDDELENLINEIGLVKNKMIKEFDGMKFSVKNFPLIYKAYEDYKRVNLYMDFDDMLTYAYSILTRCPDILGHYKKRYQFIQVDEGQDLSKIQFEILKLLVKSEQNNLFIVADDDQSIYGFRGAEPKYILDIEKEFLGCRLLRLETNYRSSRNIVEISSSFIKKNKERYEKSHITDNDYKYDPAIIQVKDESEQIKLIIDKIQNHHKQRDNVEIAVLYRNNLSSVAIVDALDRNGITFKIKQNRLFFFKHWVVQDIMAFLRFSINQSDGESFTRIYYKMNRFISKSMLEYAQNVGYTDSVIDGILKSKEIKNFQRNTICELKLEFKRLAKKHPLQALDYIRDCFKYFESVKEYCENTGLSFECMYRLFTIMQTIAASCPTIPIFILRMEELEALFEPSRPVRYKNSVTLTTMHSSKGLEYNCVMMVDLNNSEIPGERAVENSQKNNDNTLLEEERRLFYVAMTRAKEHLYLINPHKGSLDNENRSVFIDELIQCMNKEVLSGVGEGMLILHKKFGQGVIAQIYEIENDRIILEIDFKGIRKKFDMFTCMESGLLSFN